MNEQKQLNEIKKKVDKIERFYFEETLVSSSRKVKIKRKDKKTLYFLFYADEDTPIENIKENLDKLSAEQIKYIKADPEWFNSDSLFFNKYTLAGHLANKAPHALPLLHEKGIDLEEHVDMGGRTPSQILINNGHLEGLKYLESIGVNLNKKDAFQLDGFHFLTNYYSNKTNTIEILDFLKLKYSERKLKNEELIKMIVSHDINFVNELEKRNYTIDLKDFEENNNRSIISYFQRAKNGLTSEKIEWALSKNINIHKIDEFIVNGQKTTIPLLHYLAFEHPKALNFVLNEHKRFHIEHSDLEKTAKAINTMSNDLDKIERLEILQKNQGHIIDNQIRELENIKKKKLSF